VIRGESVLNIRGSDILPSGKTLGIQAFHQFSLKLDAKCMNRCSLERLELKFSVKLNVKVLNDRFD
jgi:hypothetical protein